MRRMWAAAAALFVCLALGLVPALAQSPEAATPSPSALPTIGIPADDGARIVGVEMLSGRMRDLTIESPSVGTVKVRLLVPSSFEVQPTTYWPVLYLLQGCCDTYDSWTRETDVEALTAPTDLLVVMPAATSARGDDGWYSDWYNSGKGGPPMWETFHLTELRQLLERNWHAGDQRIIAGLSMGGYGAMAYAARNPGLFKAAASFSGVVDLKDLFFQPNYRIWGFPVKQADVWAAHDPLMQAAALKGTPLYIAYGNGQPGPLNAPGTPPDELEAQIGKLNDTFVAKLRELGIAATVEAYGPGTHSWSYWQRDLHAALPMLLAALGETVAQPSPAPSVSPASTQWATVTGSSWCDLSAFPTIGCFEQASDPRVSGTSTRTITVESPSSEVADGLIWNDVTIVGPEGTWMGKGYAVMDTDGWGHGVEILSGSGAYQGLVYAALETITPTGNSRYVGLIQQESPPPGFPVGSGASPSPSPSPSPSHSRPEGPIRASAA